MTRLVFDVVFHGEPGAGLNPYYDIVTVTVENDPGGEDGEFAEHIREALADWFDGAGVDPREEVATASPPGDKLHITRTRGVPDDQG